MGNNTTVISVRGSGASKDNTDTETAADNTASTVDTRGCLFFHKDAIVLAEQMAVRSQTQYKQEYLSTLFTSDTLYGVQCYRPEAGFILAVADA